MICRWELYAIAIHIHVDADGYTYVYIYVYAYVYVCDYIVIYIVFFILLKALIFINLRKRKCIRIRKYRFTGKSSAIRENADVNINVGGGLRIRRYIRTRRRCCKPTAPSFRKNSHSVDIYIAVCVEGYTYVYDNVLLGTLLLEPGKRKLLCMHLRIHSSYIHGDEDKT
jgi:hypothetical protein